MRVLITGGAGFIGTHTADYYLAKSSHVTIFDNFSRRGTHANVSWLKKNHRNRKLTVITGDIRDFNKLKRVINHQDLVIHLAAQVAVTSSVTDPREDFEINALGTFNVLEATRLHAPQAIILFASTNKVYGGMEEIKIIKKNKRYAYRHLPQGIPETQNLDFHSPYGCSKGAADQYVRDYHRIYGLNTVVLRQSCLAADQEIITPFGKKPIAKLKPGNLVHTGKGWAPIKHIWKTGQKPVRRLTTMNGLAITLTEDHQVVRPNGLRPNKELTYGDFLATLPEAKFIPKTRPIPDQVLNPKDYYKVIKKRTKDIRCLNQAKQISSKLLPLKGEKLLAITEIVGHLFGDGHLGIHHRQSRVSPAYNVQYFGDKNELKEIEKRLIWLGIQTSNITSSSSTSNPTGKHLIKGTSLRIQHQSIPIFTLFELLGVPIGDKVRTKYELPNWITSGHPLVKRAFLRGFFGAELTKINQNSQIAPSFAQSKDVRFIKNGRKFLRQIRQLLSKFDISTSMFEAKPVNYNRGTTIQTTIRLLGGNEMFPKLAKIGYAFNHERAARLNAVLRWQCEKTPANQFNKITNRYHASGQLFWDSIVKIEPLGKQTVYDLEVENKTHLFVAGGVQVSNCIYGTHQFGIEDQGWVSWFTIAAVLGKPITIYGDGMQVRDVLFVPDLVKAFDVAVDKIKRASGQVYNVGGGPKFTLSLLELLDILEKKLEKRIKYKFDDWRPGDQPVYVSDIRKIKKELGWQPKTNVQAGTDQMIDWIIKEKKLIQKVLP